MYKINEIYQAIQGEGFYAGLPCTIVRMQGCNLQCDFCDTSQAQDSSEGQKIRFEPLAAKVKETLTPSRVVLITGGEPLLQDLGPLTEEMCSSNINYLLHLETNGTQPLSGTFDWITVSPKPPEACNRQLLAGAQEVKWLVKTEEDITSLVYWLGEYRWSISKFVSLQPISQDPIATQICYDACIKYGWRLSLQLHKYIGAR